MKMKQYYSAPLCDSRQLESAAMLAASYGEEGTPGSFDLGNDLSFPTPF